MESLRPIKRALISVSNKDGIVAFATELAKRNVEILSTGGTAKLLKENGIDVIEVSDYTKFPEMMDGRLKTLHPKIHGGILGRRGSDEEVMKKHDILSIDLVCVNLYPFNEVIQTEDCTFEHAIENIDIGGPTMVRAAAKNHQDVAIVVRSTDYTRIIVEMDKNQNSLTYKTRFDLAVAAFEHTAAYDASIANHFGLIAPDYGINANEHEEEIKNIYPRTLNLNYRKIQSMRYGENPHQSAAFYKVSTSASGSIATAFQYQGKELSFNNIADTDTAIECVREFTDPACVIVKHANPCGVAIAKNPLEAYQKAYEGDKESAFGGIIAFNCELDAITAKTIIGNQFCEVIVATSITNEALTILEAKPNIRVLATGTLTTRHERKDVKSVHGGLLIQDADIRTVTKEDLKFVTDIKPTDEQIKELLFAWNVCKYAKSNAIVFSNNNRTLGIGCGQTSRVFASKCAILRAKEANLSLENSFLASDAFFPFRDSIDEAAKVGVKYIIQPGGSIRDEEVIKACNEHGICMVFTGVRHFRH